tara:strand:- start:3983 stop:5065 length:1083 start_codon:yes stop_codon:yes gene_type:complete
VVAQELGLGAPGEHEHIAVEEIAVNPWTREMFRSGLSFNGNERNKIFLGSPEGELVDLSDVLGADSPLDGRALVAADFDDDGDADLFIHNIQRERHVLLRNDLGRPGRSISVRLRGRSGNDEAIGAQVLARSASSANVQILARGAGFATCDAPELLFGAGTNTELELSVLWPGSTEFASFGKVPAGARVVLVQGESEPRDREVVETQLSGPWPAGLKLGPGEVVPILQLESAAGVVEAIDPSELGVGEELHLHFWASYCRPCVRHLPDMAKGKPAGIRVVPISLDAPKDRYKAEDLLRRAGVTLASRYVALADEHSLTGVDQLVDFLRLPIPTTIVLGPGGRVLRVQSGAPSQANPEAGR